MNLRPALLVGIVSLIAFPRLVAQGAQKDNAAKYHEPFQGMPRVAKDFELVGSGAKECVKFEDQGVRITLPAGTSRPPIGVATNFGLKGDFDVSVSYEIFREPEQDDSGAPNTGTRISLTLKLDATSEAAIRRKITPALPVHILAWRTIRPAGETKQSQKGANFPVTHKTGRLRLERKGTEVSYYLADGDGDFKLLTTFPFVADDIQTIQLTGHASSPTAALDARFKDLRVEAASLPRKAVAVAAPTDKIPTKEYAQTYREPFRGTDVEGWQLSGPKVGECVRFEPAGLHFTLPAGWTGQRPSVGVKSGFRVQGDFEITAQFEMLKEPEPADAGKLHTRMGLEAILDTPRTPTPNCDMATINRIVASKGKEFISWVRLWDAAADKSATKGRSTPTTASTVRLRLIRSGADLYYLTSEGADVEFKLRAKLPFDAGDLDRLQIIGTTGGERASLEARVTDVVVRADAIPGAPVAALVATPNPVAPTPAANPPASPASEGGTWWMLILSAVVALLLVMVILAAGGWFLLRKRGVTPVPVAEKPATRDVSFACPKCQRSLKTKANAAGKKVKCPHCSTMVVVPDARFALKQRQAK